jgi:hypothetical protein
MSTFASEGDGTGGDSAFKPYPSRKEDADWPTIVFEAGLSKWLGWAVQDVVGATVLDTTTMVVPSTVVVPTITGPPTNVPSASLYTSSVAAVQLARLLFDNVKLWPFGSLGDDHVLDN